MSMGKEKKSVSINMDDIITRAGGMQKIDASHTSDADKFDTDGGTPVTTPPFISSLGFGR